MKKKFHGQETNDSMWMGISKKMKEKEKKQKVSKIREVDGDLEIGIRV